MTKVIQFVAGPSAGKSTIAPGVYSYMKSQRMNVEFVPEFAKELSWQDNAKEALDDQLLILGVQNNRQYKLLDKVDWIVTDTSIALGLVYARESNRKFKSNYFHILDPLTYNTFKQYNNIVYFVDRGDRKFIQAGRVHDEEQSRAKDREIKVVLRDWEIPFKEIKTIEDVIRDLGF